MKTRKDTYKGILQRMRLGNQEDNKGVVIRVGNLSVREELPRLYPGPYNGVHNLVRGCKGEGASTTSPLTPRRGPSRTTYSGGPTWDQACLRRIGILKFVACLVVRSRLHTIHPDCLQSPRPPSPPPSKVKKPAGPSYAASRTPSSGSCLKNLILTSKESCPAGEDHDGPDPVPNWLTFVLSQKIARAG